MQSITLDDLLQYLYKETSPERTVEIMDALEKDADLREKLETMSLAKKRLDMLSYSPENQTIDNILAYSKGLSPDKS